VVASADSPPDLYLPDAATLARARVLLGDAPYGDHACTIAVAPAPSVCRRRHPDRALGGFPAPIPIVAALDLAYDPARGRETLERWSTDLPEELTRVW